jgi:alcohol dehydrogenase
MDMMNALVYTGTRQMDYQRQALPRPGPGEALVKIEAVGICGSDMHAYHGHDPRRVPPMVLGHEAAGRVLEGRLAGRRVTMNPIAFCGECEYCLGGRQNLCQNRTMIGMSLPGAFAEYIRVPEQCLIELPEEADPAVAALTEPAATALHAVDAAERLAGQPVSAGSALVIGAGAIGLLTALILKARGCRHIVIAETNPLRRATAQAADCGEVLDPAGAGGEAGGFALVFDAVGASATRRRAIEAVRPGGVIVHIGLLEDGGDFDVRRLTLAEVVFAGVYTYSQNDLRTAARMLLDGALGGLGWVAHRGLPEGAQAFVDLHEGREAAAKVILVPGT